MFINHLTLSTGHNRRIRQGDVDGEALARIGPWLGAVIEADDHVPLPLSELADYSGHATLLGGGLVITVCGVAPTSGPMQGSRPPLVTMGVARRSRHARVLWPLMTGPVMPPALPGIVMPEEPWCAVAIWPTVVLHPDALDWLGSLDQCIAWAWVNRPSHDEDPA